MVIWWHAPVPRPVPISECTRQQNQTDRQTEHVRSYITQAYLIEDYVLIIFRVSVAIVTFISRHVL